MKPARCLQCDNAIDSHRWRQTGWFELGSTVLLSHYEEFTAACSCGACNVCNEWPLQANRVFAWLKSQEQLVDLKDYTTTYSGNRAARIGCVPLDIYWLWNPALTDRDLQGKIAESVRELQPSNHRVGYHNLAILGPDQDITPDLYDRFDLVINLEPHVLSDATSLFPSLRAERSIKATWGAMQNRKLVHYWPAASLFESNRVKVQPDAELAKAWATHVRSFMPLSVQESK